jgi:hypothetical protein
LSCFLVRQHLGLAADLNCIVHCQFASVPFASGCSSGILYA